MKLAEISEILAAFLFFILCFLLLGSLPLSKFALIEEDKGHVGSDGRAIYEKPMHLWINFSGNLIVADFTTRFSFVINSLGISNEKGDGFAFFLAPKGSQVRPVGGDHVAIDVNTVQKSFNAVEWRTQNLSVLLHDANDSTRRNSSSLSTILDLRKYLPEWVTFGFSGATAEAFELHTIYSWDFRTSLEGFQDGLGPRKFSLVELANATSNFKGEKLGKGGFGAVYRGYLRDLDTYVSVKRISKTSKQGFKEFESEVRIISRLRHKNLIKPIGWCHEKGELLVIYEFMANGSLDSHLFKRKSLLTWQVRYKIVQGLASALSYLHEEGDHCVLHRDIKTNNVMLDSSFNAKLGDFGLARLVDHAKDSQTTHLINDGLYGSRMECLLVVGLWCVHPDPNLRPPMRQAIQVLNFDSPLPKLPGTRPTPVYGVVPMASGIKASEPCFSTLGVTVPR
ncbi:hypothetical protein PTKIN_Ptkin10aG0111500 [Pterospermum kingtungense]